VVLLLPGFWRHVFTLYTNIYLLCLYIMVSNFVVLWYVGVCISACVLFFVLFLRFLYCFILFFKFYFVCLFSKERGEENVELNG
jgi:membrane protein implicated in regulation of membrane protease activity